MKQWIEDMFKLVVAFADTKEEWKSRKKDSDIGAKQ